MSSSEASLHVVFSDESGRLELDLPRLERVLLEVLRDHGRERGTLSIALVDDATIRRAHREFLGKDTPTDCISFPLDGEDDPFPSGDPADPQPAPFGEVLVSLDTACREAEARGLDPRDEAALYAIHGTLHLVGHDDLDPEVEPAMRRAEAEYLERYREAGGEA